MRALVTLLGLAVASAVSLRGQFLIPRSGVERDFVQVEPHGAMSVSYAQVLLRVTNNQISPIFIPVCSADSYEVCGYFAHIEQREDTTPAKWQRTRIEPLEGGDVLAPRSVLRIEKGESSGLVFRFHPRGRLLPDGSHLKYPGKIRLVILAWQDEKYASDPTKAVELTTQEFEIPPPPDTWGTQSAP